MADMVNLKINGVAVSVPKAQQFLTQPAKQELKFQHCAL